MTGHVQRAIASAFEAKPEARFTTRQLAAFAYPGVPVERKHMIAVTRAIASIKPVLTFCRGGTFGQRGWRHYWGRA